MNTNKLLSLLFIFFAIVIIISALFFLWASLNIFKLSLEQITDIPYLSFYKLYTIGEFSAFIGLLTICIPIIFNINNTSHERLNRRNTLFLLLMLIFLSIAYTVRIPVDSSGQNILFNISRHTQLRWLTIVGCLSSLFGIMALMKIWPQTLITLLLMYFVFFSTGIIIINRHTSNDSISLIILALVILFMLIISMLALSKHKSPNKPTETKTNINAQTSNTNNQISAESRSKLIPLATGIGSLVNLSEQIKTEIHTSLEHLKTLRDETNHIKKNKTDNKKQTQQNHQEIMQKLDELEKKIKYLS